MPKSKETPIKAKLTENRQYQQEVLEQAREAVAGDLGGWVPEVSFHTAQRYLLPAIPDIDISSTIKVLEGRKIWENGSWANFIKPSLNKAGEDVAFFPLKSVYENIKKNVQFTPGSIPRQPTIQYLPCAFTIPATDMQNTSRPDGFGILLASDPISMTSMIPGDNGKGTKPKSNWWDIGFSDEYKKKNVPESQDDNANKVLWSMQYVMRNDPRRRFTFGITMEDTTTRLWFCSRQVVIVTKPFDFMKDHSRFIYLAISFLYGTTNELGWDPTFKLQREDQKWIYDITVHHREDGRTVSKIYRTLETISNYAADAIRGHATRVYRVYQINPNGEKIGNHVVLKDSWIDSTREREEDVLKDILKYASDGDREFFLTPIVWGDVPIDDREDNTEDVIMRGLKVMCKSSSDSDSSKDEGNNKNEAQEDNEEDDNEEEEDDDDEKEEEGEEEVDYGGNDKDDGEGKDKSEDEEDEGWSTSEQEMQRSEGFESQLTSDPRLGDVKLPLYFSPDPEVIDGGDPDFSSGSKLGSGSESSLRITSGYSLRLRSKKTRRTKKKAKQSIGLCEQVNEIATLPTAHHQFHAKVHHRIVFVEVGTPLGSLKTMKDILQVCLDAIKALEIMYRAGYVHRDVSPSNILSVNLRGKLIDLEYAKKVNTASQHNVRTGTLDFISTEVAKGRYRYYDSNVHRRNNGGRKAQVAKLYHNPLHDIESVWWVLVHSCLFKTLDKEPGSANYPFEGNKANSQLKLANQIFAQSSLNTARVSFFNDPDDVLTKTRKLTFSVIFEYLDTTRTILLDAYRIAEKELPNGGAINEMAFTSIHAGIIGSLEGALSEEIHRKRLCSIQDVLHNPPSPTVSPTHNRNKSQTIVNEPSTGQGKGKRKHKS